MTALHLGELELTEFTGKDDPLQHCKATFPLFAAHGTSHLATVYFEIEPGDNLGRHTDSAEELLVILEGEAEVWIDKEQKKVSKGGLALAPQFALHDIKNTGSNTLKVLGVFGGANNIVASFDKTWLPANSKVVDTLLLIPG
jgi:quercetin dioxygenase-like cupin family protein